MAHGDKEVCSSSLVGTMDVVSTFVEKKTCACTGIRYCARCRDPVSRTRWGLHPIRDWNKGRVLGRLEIDSQGNIGLHENCPAHPSDAVVEVPPLLPATDLLVRFPDGTAFRPTDLRLDGLQLYPDFLTPDEEEELLELLDTNPHVFPWSASQSGRRKCDFGPKVNYKQQTVRVADAFRGVPKQLLESRAIQKLRVLFDRSDFAPAGYFFQEYRGAESSNFEPHIDHEWFWGNSIFDLNLLEDSILSFFSPEAEDERHFADEGSSESSKGTAPAGDEKDVEHSGDRSERSPHFDGVLGDDQEWSSAEKPSAEKMFSTSMGEPPTTRRSIRVDVPLPRRCLLVFSGAARYKWQHAILEEAVVDRRISLTVRELSGNLEKTEIGKKITGLVATPVVD